MLSVIIVDICHLLRFFLVEISALTSFFTTKMLISRFLFATVISDLKNISSNHSCLPFTIKKLSVLLNFEQ